MSRLESIFLGTGTPIQLKVARADPSDKYLFKGADGLGPSNISVFQKNGVLQGRIPDDKVLVIRIGLNPRRQQGETVEGLREELYNLLSGPSGAVLVRFNYDGLTKMYTTGYISGFEIAPFNRETEVQITLETTSPFFLSQEQDIQTALGKGTFTITNKGSAPSGVYMSLTFTKDQPATGFWLKRTDITPNPTFHVGYPTIKLGDTLVFNTEPRGRFVKLIRGSTTINLIDYLTAESTWIELRRGQNPFQTSDTNFNWGQNQVWYRPKYWGV